MLTEIKKIRSERKNLREFGLTVGTVLIIVGGFSLWRGKGLGLYLFPIGGFLIVSAVLLPVILLPFQKAWMALGIVLGFFMSRIVLAIIFYGVVTPIGCMMHLMGNDILDEKIDRSATTYWKKRPSEPRPKKSYENQY